MSAWWSLLPVLALLLTLAACRNPQSPSSAPVTANTPVDETTTVEVGRKVYNARCYFCHGYSGDARTLAATYLTPKPRDFTAGPSLDRDTILKAVQGGRDGTAMKAFRGVLDDAEMQAVATFVEREFVREKAPNSAYHTAANGWPDHNRFAAAYPFATGAIKLDAPTDALGPEQRQGRQLFLSSCVSCHDRAHVDDEGPVWSARPLSFPRMGFAPGQAREPLFDAVSGASAYAKHDVAPRMARLSQVERHGEALFQSNCAFCHGADGTGKNWIGQFMEPKARDLTAFTRRTMPPPQLVRTIRDGLPATSMPAWRSVLTRTEIDAVAAYVSRALIKPEANGS